MLACLHYTGLDFQSLMRIGAFQRLRRGISIHLALDSSYDSICTIMLLNMYKKKTGIC